jgi:hypothetical protein
MAGDIAHTATAGRVDRLGQVDTATYDVDGGPTAGYEVTSRMRPKVDAE